MSNIETSDSNNDQKPNTIDQLTNGLIIKFLILFVICVAVLFGISFAKSLTSKKDAIENKTGRSSETSENKDSKSPLSHTKKTDNEIESESDKDNDSSEKNPSETTTPSIRDEILEFYNKNKTMTEDFQSFEEEYFDYLSNVNMVEDDFLSMFDDEQFERISTEMKLHFEEIKDIDSATPDIQVKMYVLYSIVLQCEIQNEDAVQVLLKAEKLLSQIDSLTLKQAVYFELGKLFTKIYVFPNAKIYYTKLIELNTSYYLGYYLRGMVNYYMSELKDALSDFQNQLKLEDDQEEINLNHYEEACILSAKILQLQYQTPKAIELAKKSLEYFDDKIENLVYLADLYMFMENYDSAKDYLNDAEFLDDSDSEVILAKCKLMREYYKEYEDALVLINDLLYKTPDDYLAYNERGKLYTNLRLYEAAFSDFNRAIKLAPMYANAYGNRGWIYYKYLNKRDKALSDYNNAILLDTNLEYVYNNRGVLLMESFHNNSKAVEDFSQALKIKPKYYLAYINRGIAERKLGEYNNSIKDFTEAKKIDDENYIAFYHLGKTYLLMKEYEKSIESFTQAIDRNDEIWEPYYDRAKVKIEINKLKSAKSDLDEALRIEPLLTDDKVFQEALKKCQTEK